MMVATLAVAALLLGQVAEPGAADLKKEVFRLVRQLNSNELAQRDAAEKSLIELGPAALDLIKIDAATPPDAKQRLGRVRAALERAAAEATAKPTKITLQADAQPLADVLAALSKQSGNAFIDLRPNLGQEQTQPKVTVALDGVPFWEAADAVLDAANLTTYAFGAEGKAIGLMNRPEHALPRRGRGAYAGPFRLEATSVEARRDLRDPTQRSLRVTLEVCWEPRLRPITLDMPVADLKATGPDGEAIAVAGGEAMLSVAVQPNIAQAELDVLLDPPARSVAKLSSLSGKMHALVPGRMETFEFGELKTAKNVEQRRGGVTVMVESVQKNDEIYEVYMQVKFDEAANALESHRGWIFANDAYLLDAAGNKVEHAGFETTRQQPNAVGVAYKFVLDDGLGAHRFVYKTPAAIVKLPVEFALKEIELP